MCRRGCSGLGGLRADTRAQRGGHRPQRASSVSARRTPLKLARTRAVGVDEFRTSSMGVCGSSRPPTSRICWRHSDWPTIASDSLAWFRLLQLHEGVGPTIARRVLAALGLSDPDADPMNHEQVLDRWPMSSRIVASLLSLSSRDSGRGPCSERRRRGRARGASSCRSRSVD